MKFVYSTIILILLLSEILNACEDPMPGMFMNTSELLKSAKEVYLVRLITEEENFSFKVIEIIIGPEKDRIEYSSSYNKLYDSTTFNNHTDSTFWAPWTGRSQHECCECSPQHTFREDDYYLLFPEYIGSRKYAERIVSLQHDKWIEYVRTYYKKN